MTGDEREALLVAREILWIVLRDSELTEQFGVALDLSDEAMHECFNTLDKMTD